MRDCGKQDTQFKLYHMDVDTQPVKGQANPLDQGYDIVTTCPFLHLERGQPNFCRFYAEVVTAIAAAKPGGLILIWAPHVTEIDQQSPDLVL